MTLVPGWYFKFPNPLGNNFGKKDNPFPLFGSLEEMNFPKPNKIQLL
jgi:hypothetical protein